MRLLYGYARRWGQDVDTYGIQCPRYEQHLAFGLHLGAGIPLAELQARSVLRALASRCTHRTLDDRPVRVLNNSLCGHRGATIAVELSSRTSTSSPQMPEAPQGPVP